MKLSEILEKLKDAIPPARTQDLGDAIKEAERMEVWIDYQDHIIKSIKLESRDVIIGSTELCSVDDGLTKMDLTGCCGIGPITNENYCPNCGKEIIT